MISVERQPILKTITSGGKSDQSDDHACFQRKAAHKPIDGTCADPVFVFFCCLAKLLKDQVKEIKAARLRGNVQSDSSLALVPQISPILDLQDRTSLFGLEMQKIEAVCMCENAKSNLLLHSCRVSQSFFQSH